MRIIVLVILFFLSLDIKAKNNNDTKASICLTTYPFAYQRNIHNPSFAIGPSFILSEKILRFQIGVLFDIKKYTFYTRSLHSQPLDTVNGYNFILPYFISL